MARPSLSSTSSVDSSPHPDATRDSPETATPRFFRLHPKKRQRIEKAATAEFATKGYELANTNDIAEAAEISVGALFAYFPTKRKLFTHILRRGNALIEGSVGAILSQDSSVMDTIEKLLDLIVDTSNTEREAVQLYQLLASPGDREGARRSAVEFERFTAQAYIQLMDKGQDCGELRTDVPAQALALHLDNNFVMLQYALASDYYEQRLALYGGASPDSLKQQTLALIRSALQPAALTEACKTAKDHS